MTTSAIVFQREKKLSHFMLSHFQYTIQSNLMSLRSFILTYQTVFIYTEKQQEWMKWVQKKTSHSKLNCCTVQEH